MPDPALPASLVAGATDGAAGDIWLAGLPRLVRDVCAQWRLTADGSVTAGTAALAVPVRTERGEPAVARFARPRAGIAHEHLALRAWAGEGAVRLLQADPRRSVLLLERAGERDLTTVPVAEACSVVAGLYGRLHRPALPQLDRLDDLAARWAEGLTGLRTDGRVPRRYLDQAVGLARELTADPGCSATLVHADLHYANVLASTREPWLAISPEPLAGEPAYEVAPMLRHRWAEAAGSGNVRQAVLDRLFALVDGAGLDEDRVRGWVVVRVLADLLGALTGASARRSDLTDRLTAAVTLVKAVQR